MDQNCSKGDIVHCVSQHIPALCFTNTYLVPNFEIPDRSVFAVWDGGLHLNLEGTHL